MNANTLASPRRHWRRRRHITPQPSRTDLGFGYSREPDTLDRPEPVPAGVDLYFFTGRTRRSA